MSLWRMLDANGNRAMEGLRVLEDLTRFVLLRSDLQAEARKLRHKLGEILTPFSRERLQFRDAAGDFGFDTSRGDFSDSRSGIPALAAANIRRVSEALRVIEESLKTLGHYPEGKNAEILRQNFYDLEPLISSAVLSLSRLKLPEGLYGITAEMFSRGRKNQEVVRLLIEGGVKIIQYREKEKSIREKLAECREIRKLTRDGGIPFIVNDDPLIALETEADGVHIGQDDHSPSFVRSVVGPRMMIGLSTHSPEQAAEAVASGVDYIGVGPIYPTKTKKDVCAAVGIDYLKHVSETYAFPFVAIGGIKEKDVPEVIRAGARTIAMVTALTDAEDIPRTVRQINQIMERTRNERK